MHDSVACARPDLREGPYAVLTVTNTGHGIEPGVRARVFEPFFTTKAPGEGTGLGLAVVHGIMRDHGGAVELESEPGRGTTVRCLFPAILTDADAEQEAEPILLRGRGEHILFVEDEPSLAQVSARRLTALGYRITVETDSHRALELFRERSREFDAVITDYSMPRMSGLELVQAMRRVRPDIPIAMITGFTDGLSTEAVMAAGVRRLVKKPATGSDLAAAVQALLVDKVSD